MSGASKLEIFARLARPELAKWGPRSLLAAVAIAFGVYVVVYPFVVVRYPPITDFPFHASAISIFRHYWDPAWGFQQQFTLHPLEVPYMSLYALGALFALVMPMTWAAKGAAIVMLALMPVGLAVLFHGMKKSPLWGLLGLGLVWTHLTHWGFLNFMGAFGLYAMSLGFALLALDRPTRRRQVGLALSLLAVFFTHLFRFPFALLSVVGATVLMYPATRRIRPVLWPLLPSLAVYGAWRLVPTERRMDTSIQLEWAPGRLAEAREYLFRGFVGTAGHQEQRLFAEYLDAVLVAGLVCAFLFLFQKRLRRLSVRQWWWGIGVTLLPLLLAGGFLIGYFALPMRIGLWWYVYPREVTAVLFIALAVVPDMPKQWWLRLPIVLGLGWYVGRIGFFVAKEYHAFDKATADFAAVVRQIPQAPRLAYLIFDHSGSSRSTTPFIHLPAWVQAEKGGALSFHFIGWNHSPIRYRRAGEWVPPPVPEHWEWRPGWFDVNKHGPFFDWFLVRRQSSPAATFSADPSIVPVAHQGSWWLYRRAGAPAAP